MIWVLGIALVVALGAAIHLQTELRDAHEEIAHLLAEVQEYKKNDLRPSLGLLVAFKRPFSLHWGFPDYVLTEDGDGRGPWGASGTIQANERYGATPLAVTSLEFNDPMGALDSLTHKLEENKRTGTTRW